MELKFLRTESTDDSSRLCIILLDCLDDGDNDDDNDDGVVQKILKMCVGSLASLQTFDDQLRTATASSSPASIILLTFSPEAICGICEHYML